MISVLTDSVKSPAKEFFDSDAFAVMKQIGIAVSECQFGRARSLLKEIAQTSTMTNVKDQIEATSLSFTKFAVRELVSCYSQVRLSEIANELSITDQQLIAFLEELIPEHESKIGAYRIDMRTRTLTRRELTDALREMETAANIDITLRELQMLCLRRSIADNNIAVE